MSPTRPLKWVLNALLLALIVAPAARAATAIPVKPFQSVTLRNGGEVILRHGKTQKVTVLEGNRDCVSATVDDGELVIENDRHDCNRGNPLIVEVSTPELEQVMVSDGGKLYSIGTFPQQKKLVATVNSGGLLDVRSMQADEVLATVNSGGRILTRPVQNLLATVLEGGIITYWGDAHVISTIQHGGYIGPGKAGDASKPLNEVTGYLAPAAPPIPPAPPVPPTPPTPPSRRVI